MAQEEGGLMLIHDPKSLLHQSHLQVILSLLLVFLLHSGSVPGLVLVNVFIIMCATPIYLLLITPFCLLSLLIIFLLLLLRL